jgi:nitrogen fixation NifU-like protein
MNKSPYRERILEHYQNPRHLGRLESPDQVGDADNPVCGDRVHLELRVDENGKVSEAAFQANGCVICLAASSILVEHIHGLGLDELENLAEQDVLQLIGVELGRARTQCALVAWQALTNALKTPG